MVDRAPPIRKIVLYKHGIAYVERAGAVAGSFEVSFKKDEMNDVLKSLSVWAAKGQGRVGALAFEAPEDAEEALRARNLSFAPGATLFGLLQSLRGSRLRCEVAASRGEAETEPRIKLVEGELVGLERTQGGDGGERLSLVLAVAVDEIVTLDVERLAKLVLVDRRAVVDLGYLLDKAREGASDASRTVRIAVDGPIEDVRLAYVVPAPVWRVSYRIVATPTETRIFGWGIVHNPTEEPLVDVELTLTTGAPVSFFMDLYSPKRVERAIVEEQARTGAPPPRFGAAPRSPSAVPPSPGAHSLRKRAAPSPQSARMQAMALEDISAEAEMDDEATVHGLADALRSAEPQAEGAGRGELFDYRVLAPVSLGRGAAAMVPLLSAELDARKERIWRPGSGPHPSLVLAFDNASGVVLEEGPAVVYDDGAYTGEAVVPYVPTGGSVRLGYGTDLAVTVRHSISQHVVVTGLRLGDELLVEEQRREQHHLFLVDNQNAEQVEVVVEIPRSLSRTFDSAHATPTGLTPSHASFTVTVPARGQAQLTAVETWADARHVRYTHIQPAELERWMGQSLIARDVFDDLGGVLALWAQARDADTQREQAERTRTAAYTKQQKIGEQLAVLKESGPEGALRLRYVTELEREQDRVNACEATIERLQRDADALRAEARERLRARVARGSAA